MSLSVLWPLCLLPLIGIIIIFYLLKQPAREKLVSSTQLWQQILQEQHSEQPWEKFRNNLLMYLQILTILILILALCTPVLKGRGNGNHLFLVLDTSYSMQTLVSENGTTRMDSAKKQACELVEKAKNGTTFTVIAGYDTPEILLNTSSNRESAKSAIRSITATDCSGSLQNSISACQTLIDELENVSCVFFTDNSLDTQTLPAEIYNMNYRDNEESTILTRDLAISYFDWYTVDKQLRVSFTFDISTLNDVKNNENKKETIEAKLYVNDILSATTPCTLTDNTPNTNTILLDLASLPLLENGQLRLKLEIDFDDAFPANNTSYTVYTPSTDDGILLVSEKNTFLENSLTAGISSNGQKIYKMSSISDYNEKETYDLVIFDGMFPKSLPEHGSVILFPNGSDMKTSLAAYERLLPDFSATVEKNQWLTMEPSSLNPYKSTTSFGVTSLLAMESPKHAESIFSLDNTAASGCYSFRENRRLITAFGFDLHNTEFPLLTDYPILMYHLFHASTIQKNFEENNYAAGKEILYYPSSVGSQVMVQDMNGNEIMSFTPATPFACSSILTETGIYDFYTPQTNAHAYTAVNFIDHYGTQERIFETPDFSANETAKDSAQTVQKPSEKGSLPLQKTLLVLCLTLLLIEFAVWFARTWSKRSLPLSLVLRALLIALVCLSIFDPHITFGSGKETTLFVVDVSDSMGRTQKEVASVLSSAVSELPKGSRAGIIAFGSDVRVEQFITSDLHFNGIETTPVSGGTNLESALKTAAAMFPSDDRSRMILITDGQENEGSAKEAANAILNNEISLKVLEVSNTEQAEALISNVKVPESLLVGDNFQVEVTVESNTATDAILSLYSGETLTGTKSVSLSAGTNRFLFQDTLTKSGLVGYRAIIEPKQDTEAVNNEYMTFTHAEEPPVTLLIEGKRGEAENFEKLLASANIEYKTIQPQSAPKNLLKLKKYPAVLLENVHADDLPGDFLNILPAYVNEGGGLVAIGGDNSFALGNYMNTSLEEILPVNSVLTDQEETAETAMALVIDHSGSMDTRLSLAKEAAISAFSSLTDMDSIGVLAFDDTFDWIVPMTRKGDASTDEIELKIAGIHVGGGTSIYPAVAEAAQQLKKQETAKYKHIILLTDGQDGYTKYSTLYQELTDNHITLSTVAVSGGADTKLLKQMAKSGGGRYYYTDLSTDIPRIFAQEVYLSSDSYLINEETPIQTYGGVAGLNMDALNGLSVYGYIATSLASNLYAAQLAGTPDGHPLFAVRNYGLGLTAAFTSDVTNEWTQPLAGLDSYRDFWKNLIETCYSHTEHTNFGTLDIEAQNNYVDISYHVQLGDAQPYTLKAICTDENGSSFTVPLSYQEKDSTYNGEANLPNTGAYTVSIVEESTEDSGNTTQNLLKTGAFASIYSKEYRLFDNNSTLDELIELTGAETLSLSELSDTDNFYNTEELYSGDLAKTTSKHSLTTALLLCALTLFLIDIAVRRFGIPQGIKTALEKIQGLLHNIADFFIKNKFAFNKTVADRTMAMDNSSQESAQKTASRENIETAQENAGTASTQDTEMLQRNTLSQKKQTKQRIQRTKKTETTSPELLDTSKLLSSRRLKK